MSKEAKQAKRERVEDINKCDTPASVAEYLEDNPFLTYNVIKEESNDYYLDSPHMVQKLLEHALYKPTNLNFTQYQLKLQILKAPTRAYAVLLRIMEIRFGLERLDL